MRGRKPKPTASQIAAGDPRKLGKRKLEEKLRREPKATRGLPDCPRHLKGRARSAWTFWSEELAVMSQDHRPDAMALEGACQNYARAVEADLIVAKDGIIVEELQMIGPAGAEEPVVMKRKYHPAITVSNAAWRQVRAFVGEFGFSPVSRTRLALEKSNDAGEQDLMEMLSRPRQPKVKQTVQ
jgi:P27 family predicted phage terminase small subunit